MSTPVPTRPPEEVLLAFTRALRAAGVGVTHDRAQGFLDAAVLVGAQDPDGIFTAGAATLCASPDDLVRYRQVFAAWFADRLPQPGRPTTQQQPAQATLPLEDPPPGRGEDDAEEEPVRARASAQEVLRQRDVADLSPTERQRLAALFATLPVRPPRRRTGRHQPFHRGEVDAHATLRATLRRAGEPGDIAWRRRAPRARRVVVLVDVSGSMSGYADALLRLAHRITVGVAHSRVRGGRVETFTLGTRLTRLTRALRSADVERALVAAGGAVPDWSGGTRLGETLRAFTDRYAALARGAVVVVCSDGWERGDTSMLADQLARLGRLSHRLVWVNPHRGKDGYLPVQAGVVAALPHVDDFLAGHSLATFAELLEVLADA